MATDPDDSPWSRQLLIGVGAILAVALIVGGILSLVALGAARMSGLASSGTDASMRPSLYIPPLQPTRPQQPAPAPASTSAAPSPSPSPSPTTSPKPKPRPQISLQASPLQVSANQRIDLTGVYPRGEGHSLTVQRLEAGAWTNFPVTTSVSGGGFHTWVTTGRAGMQQFRVLDPATGRHSNAVRVRVA
jgi:hypothetical protein